MAYLTGWQKLFVLISIFGVNPIYPSDDPNEEIELTLEEKKRQKDMQTKSQLRKHRLNSYVSRAPYFVMPTMRIPVIKNGIVYAFFFAQFEFKAGPGFWSRTKYMRHRLQNDLFIDLYHSLSVLWSGEHQIQVDPIKMRALKVAEKTYGKGAIIKVFLRRISTEFLIKNKSPYQRVN